MFTLPLPLPSREGDIMDMISHQGRGYYGYDLPSREGNIVDMTSMKDGE